MQNRQTLLTWLLVGLLAMQFYGSHWHGPIEGSATQASGWSWFGRGSDTGTPPPAVPPNTGAEVGKKVSDLIDRTVRLPKGEADATYKIVKVENRPKEQDASEVTPGLFDSETEAAATSLHLVVKPRGCNSCTDNREFVLDLSKFGLTEASSTIADEQQKSIWEALNELAAAEAEQNRTRERAKKLEAERAQKQAEADKKEKQEREEKYARCEADKRGNPIDTAIERAECWGDHLANVDKGKNKDGKARTQAQKKSELSRIYAKLEKELRSLLRRKDNFDEAKDLAEKVARQLVGDDEEKYANKLTAMVLGAEITQKRDELYDRAQTELRPLFVEAFEQQDPYLQQTLYQEALRQQNLLSNEYNNLQRSPEFTDLYKMAQMGQITASDYSQLIASDVNNSFEQLMRNMLNPKTIYRGLPTNGTSDYSGYNSGGRLSGAGGAPITSWSDFRGPDYSSSHTPFPSTTYDRFNLGNTSFPQNHNGINTYNNPSYSNGGARGYRTNYPGNSDGSNFYGTYSQVYGSPSTYGGGGGPGYYQTRPRVVR